MYDFLDIGNADIVTYTTNRPNLNLIATFDSIWAPDTKFIFPSSVHRNLKFQLSWLHRFSWLSYSKAAQGAFCKVCVLFGKKVGGVGDQNLGSFVTKPYTDWKKAIEKCQTHSSKTYHCNAVVQMELRRVVEQGKQLPVNLQINEQNKKIIEENKNKLRPIIETILLCGRQGLPLRGNSHYVDIREQPVSNEGNFRALLRYRASVDIDLSAHLGSCAQNAKYLSHRVQNEMIDCAQKLISQKIVEAVNSSRSFSVLADESADIAGIEQMSIVVRYFNDSTKSIHEDFLTFVAMKDCSGEMIAKSILGCLRSNGIKCEYLVGQGYDGARAMSGKFHGAQSYIQREYNMALYVHCAAHSLNLVVSETCEVPLIRNCMGTIEAIYVFFNTPKRGEELKMQISNGLLYN